MSTVFYGFRAKNEQDLWEQIGIAKFLAKDLRYVDDGIEFQVFNTTSGIIYRVLENGYSLRNKMWQEDVFFPVCNYDTRTERSEEDEKNKDLVDEIEGLITSKMSYLIVILPEDKSNDI